jgi:predicted AAA+ superfamily ATPase
MITRRQHLHTIRRLLKTYPVVAILGARQVGKTTLARQLVEAQGGTSTVFDLEDSRDLTRLADPMLALEDLRGLVVLDEVQRRPDLFPVLRVLADRPRRRARFLVLGSASPTLLQQASESLAGRIAFHDLSGFTLAEVGVKQLDRLWLRGGFPRSYLARSYADSMAWRQFFMRTFLERDLPQLGITVSARTLERFWSMLAHYHGQVWNASELARSFGVADTTVRHYLDILCATFMVRQLLPWTENVRKRQVKSPKIYLTDSGLLHAILGLPSKRDVEGHPKLGASWEGFLLDAVMHQLGVRSNQCYFWATHAGAELDLLLIQGRKRYGFEFKRTSSPQMTRSMHSALRDLKLTRLDVVYAGKDTFAMSQQVRAVAASRLTQDIRL